MARFHISRSHWFLLAFLAVGLICRIYASDPSWLHYDENYYINIAQNYEERGELTPHMWRLEDTSIISGGGSGYGIIVLAKLLNWMGNSLVGGRLLNAGFSLLAGWVMYFVARMWWGEKSAGVFAFLYAIASPSGFYALILKMDALAILVHALILLLFTRAVRRKVSWLYGLVAVLGVAAMEFHVLSALYLAGMAFFVAISNLLSMIEQRKFRISPETWFFFSGVLAAGLVYLAVHVLPAPQEYFMVSNTCFECDEFFVVTEFKRFLRLMTFRPIEMLVTLLVVVAAWKRGQSRDREYLIYFAGWFLAQLVIGVPPYDHYSNHMWPLLALGFAGLAALGFKQGEVERKIWGAIGYAAAVLMLVANMAQLQTGSIPYLLKYSPQETEALAYIRQHVPVNTVVMAKVPDFYPLRDYRNFLSHRDGSEYGILIRGESMTDFWERERPRVIYMKPEDLDADFVLEQYIQENNFIEVYPDLWIAPDL